MQLLHLRTGKIKYIILGFGYTLSLFFARRPYFTNTPAKEGLNAQSAKTLSRAALETLGGFLACSVQAIVIFSVQRAVVAR